jgi:hypothetical protein
MDDEYYSLESILADNHVCPPYLLMREGVLMSRNYHVLLH